MAPAQLDRSRLATPLPLPPSPSTAMSDPPAAPAAACAVGEYANLSAAADGTPPCPSSLYPALPRGVGRHSGAAHGPSWRAGARRCSGLWRPVQRLGDALASDHGALCADPDAVSRHGAAQRGRAFHLVASVSAPGVLLIGTHRGYGRAGRADAVVSGGAAGHV